MSNTTDRIYADLLASDEKGLMEYGVTVDRSDYSHADWLREAYEETLDKAKYLRRSLDTIGAGIGGIADFANSFRDNDGLIGNYVASNFFIVLQKETY